MKKKILLTFVAMFSIATAYDYDFGASELSVTFYTNLGPITRFTNGELELFGKIKCKSIEFTCGKSKFVFEPEMIPPDYFYIIQEKKLFFSGGTDYFENMKSRSIKIISINGVVQKPPLILQQRLTPWDYFSAIQYANLSMIRYENEPRQNSRKILFYGLILYNIWMMTNIYHQIDNIYYGNKKNPQIDN